MPRKYFKNIVPIKSFDHKVERPGFTETDTVAHFITKLKMISINPYAINRLKIVFTFTHGPESKHQHALVTSFSALAVESLICTVKKYSPNKASSKAVENNAVMDIREQVKMVIANGKVMAAVMTDAVFTYLDGEENVDDDLTCAGRPLMVLEPGLMGRVSAVFSKVPSMDISVFKGLELASCERRNEMTGYLVILGKDRSKSYIGFYGEDLNYIHEVAELDCQ